MLVKGQAVGTVMLYFVDHGDRKVLCIPDADDIGSFVKNAKKEWHEAHPGSSKKRGRPPLEDLVIRECMEAAKEGVLRQTDTLGKICRVVRNRIAKKSPADVPSDDTIHKYARAWKNGKIMVSIQAESAMPGMMLFTQALAQMGLEFYPWRIYMRKGKQK